MHFISYLITLLLQAQTSFITNTTKNIQQFQRNMAGNKSVMVLFTTLVLATVFGISSAKTVIVGGTTGWTIPSSPSFYSNWASQQNLQVGDVLVFNFPGGAHTVAEVAKANYDSCATTNTIGPVMSTAPASITLTQAGTHYFICTVIGHCGANQKLSVTVAAATTPTLAPKPSPPTKKTPPPASSPTAVDLPLSPIASVVPMGPMGANGAGSAPPPAENFAASTIISGFGLVSAILASAILF